ncbi:MAG: hypothetical protein IPG58_17220 [Acidobacteria bacterium]|nr:hypothetical protein [Acidobacteriota bacterium]
MKSGRSKASPDRPLDTGRGPLRRALRALAAVARTSETPIHLIMSSGTAAEDFWQHMTNGLTQPRLKCTEALFDVAFPFAVKTTERQLKNADMSHLIAVAEAQAEVAFIECGVDPMLKDREDFSSESPAASNRTVFSS